MRAYGDFPADRRLACRDTQSAERPKVFSTVQSLSRTSRRQFLTTLGMGVGGIALSELLARDVPAASAEAGVLSGPHFAPKAKRLIYLFMSGAPSQLDLFDYKPTLNRRH